MRSILFVLPPALLLVRALPTQPSLTVLYDVAGLPEKTREAAKDEAARILLQAGVRVEWFDLRVGRAAAYQLRGLSHNGLVFLPGQLAVAQAAGHYR
jgi:hypothetical protein